MRFCLLFGSQSSVTHHSSQYARTLAYPYPFLTMAFSLPSKSVKDEWPVFSVGSSKIIRLWSSGFKTVFSRVCVYVLVDAMFPSYHWCCCCELCVSFSVWFLLFLSLSKNKINHKIFIDYKSSTEKTKPNQTKERNLVF